MIIPRNQQPLTIEQIANRAPSALAREAYSKRSERYTYIPTIEVIEAMQKAGFLPFSATQSRTRDLDRREHTKHMIRFTDYVYDPNQARLVKASASQK
ncbi:MAG TPA: DUF932 domain-containing protein [Candidatus Angelobacter sp.]|nr:DUF932 domain-containing protein [Candidatus Angelobacter sp.]